MTILPASPGLRLTGFAKPTSAPVSPPELKVSSGFVGAAAAKSEDTAVIPPNELKALVDSGVSGADGEGVQVSPALGAAALVGGALVGFVLAKMGAGRRAPVPGYRPYRYRRYRYRNRW